MAERIVSIKIQADATSAVRGFAAVRDEAAELKAKVAESARSQREDWATVGKGLVAVGVAITGVGVAALKTGIQYNTLQQTTRAALSTLLGSAQAANAQMDKLDAFARNSPFAKQVFIQAQQQMLGFGVAAKDVIPALDSIQNAVAAMGGSNEQIAAISEIMSRIKSESRLSGDALQRLGYYGIDAAAIIGSQMGKTAVEIRDMAGKPGGIPVEQIWDPLVTGLQEKFGGAADNVKETFAGAMDRVKAAWRDFASELAKPLVDPNGGGALVDLLNWTADAMRNFEQLPEPIKETVTVLTGLTGASALFLGTAMLVVPQIVAFKDSLVALGVTRGAVQGGLKDMWKFLTSPWGIGLIAAATALRAFSLEMDQSKVTANQLETALKQSKSALQEMQDTASANERGITKLFIDVQQHVEDIPALLDKAATSGRGFWSSMSFNENAALDNIKELGVVLEQTASTDLPRAQKYFKQFFDEAGANGKQTLTALNEEMPGFKAALIDAAEAAGIATDDTTLLKLATGELRIETAATVAETGRQESGLIQVSSAAQEAWKEIDSLIDSLNYFNGVGQTAEQQNAKLQQTFAGVTDHIRQAKDGVEGYSLSLDESTVEGSKNRAMLADLAGQSQKTAEAIYEQELKTLGADKATENYSARLQAGRDQLIDTAKQFGLSDAAAQAFADTVYALPTKHDFKVMADTANAQNVINSFIDRNTGRTVTISVNTALGERVAGYNSQGGLTYASGGTVGFAQGGTIPGAANGVTVGGGTVFGPGTSKSDSILVRLSKGEEVIQEPYASLNRPLLKAINRGDFLPSMVQPQVVMVHGGGTSITQHNAVSMLERDPRLVMRQFGRELKGVL